MDDAKSGTVSLLSNGGPGVAISMDGGVEDKHRYHQQLQLIDEQVKKHRWIDLIELKLYVHTHTHTRTRFSGTTRVSQYQKGKTNLDFTEGRDWVAVASAGPYAVQERKNQSAPGSIQITTPRPRRSVFTGRMLCLKKCYWSFRGILQCLPAHPGHPGCSAVNGLLLYS